MDELAGKLDQRNKAQADHTKEIADRDDKISLLESQIVEVKAQLDAAAESHSTTSRIQTKQINRLEDELAKYRSSSSDAALARAKLEGQVYNMEKDIASMRGKLTNAETYTGRLEALLEKKAEEIEAARQRGLAHGEAVAATARQDIDVFSKSIFSKIEASTKAENTAKNEHSTTTRLLNAERDTNKKLKNDHTTKTVSYTHLTLPTKRIV